VIALIPTRPTPSSPTGRVQGSRADEGLKDDPADVARDGFEALVAGEDDVDACPSRNML